MANRYWVGGTATWDATAGSKWSTTSGGTGGAAVPTAADDVFFDASSGSVTVTTSGTINCLSLNFTGFTGTYTQSATINIYGGLTLSASMTFTLSATFMIFAATTDNGGAGWPITTNGKAFNTAANAIQFNGVGGKWTFQDNVNFSTSATVTLTNGYLNTNGKAVTCGTFNALSSATARTLDFGSSVITIAAGFNSSSNTTNLTIVSNTATINLTSSSSVIYLGSINWNGLSLSHASAGAMQFVAGANNGATIASLTRTGTAAHGNTVDFRGATLTITGAVNLNGNSTQYRLRVFNSTSFGSPNSITHNGSITMSNVVFYDTVVTGSAASWSGTFIGNGGGNSGITFSTARTLYAVTGGTINWSNTNMWSLSSGGSGGNNPPLPQDTARLDANSPAGTYTQDLADIGNVDCTGFTRTLNWASAVNPYVSGSITYVSAMTLTHANTVNFTYTGRGAQTITTGGKTLSASNMAHNFSCPGGSYTLLDAFTSPYGMTLNTGTLDFNGYTVTVSSFSSSSALTRSLIFTGGTLNIVTTGASIWNATVTGMTLDMFTGGVGTINITAASATNRTFNGGGLRYGIINYVVAGSTGSLIIAGNNYIDTLNFSDATNSRSLLFGAGLYNTIRNLNAQGASGRPVTVASNTSGTATYLTLVGPVSTVDYLTIQDISSTLPYKFYAGVNSTSISNNRGVILAAPVAQPYINQSVTSGILTGTSLTTDTFPLPVTAGSLLVAYLGTIATPGTITATGWTLAQSNAPYSFIYYKIADGSETSVSFSWTTSRSSQLVVEEIKGWARTPIIDVVDSNTGTATSLSTGSGATNTATPAYAVAMVTGNGSMGASTSVPTNSWHENYIGPTASTSNPKIASIPLLSTGSQSTTFAWTTIRTAGSALVIFKLSPITFRPKTVFIS